MNEGHQGAAEVEAIEESSTVQWIRAIQRGDGESAWNHLYDRFAPELTDYAAQKLGRHLQHRVSAGDVVQEAFLRAIRKLARMPDVRRGTFQRLLRLDIRRIASEKGREKGQRADLVLPMVDVAQGDAELGRDEHSVSTLLAIEEEVRRIRRAIEHLKQPYRDVIVGIDIEGRSGQEVAQACGLKENTVRKQLQRARAHLREILLSHARL